MGKNSDKVKLPAAFQKTFGEGKHEHRNTMLHRQQGVDKTTLHRAMKQMGGQDGYRGNKKKK